MVNVLKEMSLDGIKPDAQTLLNAMRYLSDLIERNPDNTCQADAQQTALSLLSEFNDIGIEPSLGTFDYFMKIFNRAKGAGNAHPIIFDIIAELEKKQKSGHSLKVVSPDDFNFFKEAMFSVCQLNNVKLAYRTHRLLINEEEMGDTLLGTFQSQSFYYK